MTLAVIEGKPDLGTSEDGVKQCAAANHILPSYFALESACIGWLANPALCTSEKQ